MSEPSVTGEELGASASTDLELLENKRTKFYTQLRYIFVGSISNIKKGDYDVSKIHKNLICFLNFRQLLTKWGTI